MSACDHEICRKLFCPTCRLPLLPRVHRARLKVFIVMLCLEERAVWPIVRRYDFDRITRQGFRDFSREVLCRITEGGYRRAFEAAERHYTMTEVSAAV